MNLTIGNTKATWKSVKTQYVGLACGLALAASAAAALVGAGSASRPVVEASRPATMVRAMSHVSSQPQVAFYIVADQQQADQVRALEEHAQWVRYGDRVAEPNRFVNIFTVRTAEQDKAAQAKIDDAMSAANFSDSNPAPSFTVVDLR
jgi:hypothetical protein